MSSQREIRKNSISTVLRSFGIQENIPNRYSKRKQEEGEGRGSERERWETERDKDRQGQAESKFDSITFWALKVQKLVWLSEHIQGAISGAR